MAVGINARSRELTDVFQNILDRLRRLESPKTIRLGPIGGPNGGATPGWTFSVDHDGNLVATPDGGVGTIIASP